MNTAYLRVKFEAWAVENGYPTAYTPDAECGVEGGPVYADSRTHAAWWAYRAGRDAALDEATSVCNRVGRRQGTLARAFAVQDCFEAVAALRLA